MARHGLGAGGPATGGACAGGGVGSGTGRGTDGGRAQPWKMIARSAPRSRTSGIRRWTRRRRALAAACTLVAMPGPSSGALEDRSEADVTRLHSIIGEPSTDVIGQGDTLLDVAFRNRLGVESVQRLNPGVDKWIPAPGTVVALPSRIVPPDVPHDGLVINIPELRLFDFRAGPEPAVLSAAVGDLEDPTPTGDFVIRDKRVDPAWTVPESIRKEKPGLPKGVPPGRDNPLGSRWMRIGRTAYGVHGTNVRWSIGQRSTHGCVRLYESEMRRLYDRTPEGTRIQIVYQPYKWGRNGADIVLEAHPDVYGRMPDRLASALSPIRALGLLPYVDIERVWQTLDELRGTPEVVGRLPPSLQR